MEDSIGDFEALMGAIKDSTTTPDSLLDSYDSGAETAEESIDDLIDRLEDEVRAILK